MTDNYIPDGFILLARKIKKSPLWRCLKATHKIVMIELLLQAQFQDGEVTRNGEIIFLKKGQIATSYQQLVGDINDKSITVKVVRNAIKKLVKHGFLAKDEAKARAKKGLLLTILNYNYYQNPGNYKSKMLSENEVQLKYDESKMAILDNVSGKGEGKDKRSDESEISTDINSCKNELGKEKDKDTGNRGAKQGQSKGKARAINKKDNNVKKDKKDKDIYNIFQHWNSKNLITHKKLTKKLKGHINARLEEGYTVQEITEAINNYAIVVNGDEYYWTYKWTLQDFLTRGLDRFKPSSDPLNNFLKEKNKSRIPRAFQSLQDYSESDVF